MSYIHIWLIPKFHHEIFMEWKLLNFSEFLDFCYNSKAHILAQTYKGFRGPGENAKIVQRGEDMIRLSNEIKQYDLQLAHLHDIFFLNLYCRSKGH